MSRSLNKVMLIGNVGNDPEIRSTSSGRRLANVSLATSERWTDNSGQQQEKTEWHRLTIWGGLVDVVEQYVKKGDRLFIEGSIKYSQTEGEGGTRYWTDINVRDIVMLGRGGGGEMFGGGPAEVVLSGPDSRELTTLSRSVRSQLESMGPIRDAWENYRPGMDEFWIEPREKVIESMGLSVSDLVPALRLAGREGVTMQTGFLLPNGRELPVAVERLNARVEDRGIRDLERLRVQTDAGAVPVRALASLRRMPAPRVILHHNGRRETTVNYNFENSVQDTGPTRLAIEEQVVAAMRAVPRPEGFTIETAPQDETTNQLQQVILPVILLLFLVLAMTFESLTLPVLVLLSLPITLLGATWAMVFAAVSYTHRRCRRYSLCRSRWSPYH